LKDEAATTAPEDAEEMVPRSELDVLQSQVDSLIDEKIKLEYETDEALKDRGYYEQERDDNKKDCQERVQRARAEQRRDQKAQKFELDEVNGQLAVEKQIHEADCRSADKKLKDTQTLLKKIEESSAKTKQNLETKLLKSTETLQQKSIKLEKANNEIARLNALLKKKRTSNVPRVRKNATVKKSSSKSSKPDQQTTNTANNQGQ
jgi:hypothetical protein